MEVNAAEEYVRRLEISVEKTFNFSTHMNLDVLDIEGYSSPYTRFFFNNICSYPDIRYLEIGCFQGSTLCSSLSNNPDITAFAIDHFKEYDPERQKKHNFFSNLEKFDTHKRCKFFESDSFKFNISNIDTKINTYFYDGFHEDWAQRKALSHYYDVLENIFIYIVDDWNWKHSVQKGTYEGIEACKLKQHYYRELKAKHNCDTTGWWNGLALFVLEKT